MVARFERAGEAVWGAKCFSRGEVNPRLGFDAAMDPAAFLARLWALFGPADKCDDGFSYGLRDRETGLTFTAYSGASGPSYGGALGGGDAMRPVVEALELLLDRTAPVDCALEVSLDVEYGGGARTIGWRDGAPFTETRDARTSPSAARSYAECVAIAAEHEGGYGAEAGWQACLDSVMPEPPERVRWSGKRFSEPVGFTIEDGVPSILYAGGGGAPEPIAVAELTFDPPLSAIATMWLAAFERWNNER